jgi:hypothetical protein
MNSSIRRSCVVLVASALAAGAAIPALAQESKSGGPAKELVTLLQQRQLDAVAARDPGDPQHFVAAMYFSGLQLLVVSAKYSVPVLITEKLGKKDYRDVYMDLNSAAVPQSRTFIEDLSGDGLKATRGDGQPFDAVDTPKGRVVFDGDWKKQKISEEDYQKAFTAADEQYQQILSLLLAELKGQKKTSE